MDRPGVAMTDRIIAPPRTTFSTGDAISSVVRDFAKKRGLDPELWHQDEPIWYLSRGEQLDDWLLTRFVQIAVFGNESSAAALNAIPGARIISEGRGRARLLPKPLPGRSFEI